MPEVGIVYSLLMDAANGKSVITPGTTETVMLPVPLKLAREIVLFGLSKAYEVPSVKAWLRCILPRMMPVPLRLLVIVRVLLPVRTVPVFILIRLTVMLFRRITWVVALILLIFRVLKVLVPLIVVLAAPASVTVPEAAVKLPLFTQLPSNESVCEAPLKVVPAAMVKSLRTVTGPPSVLVLVPDTVSLSKVLAGIVCAPVPLKLTVLGTLAVTFNEPLLTV